MADIIRPIEPFQLTQGFGGNPEAYAKFGLKGHNGWDFKTKFDDTPKGHRYIYASWLMQFYRRGVDPNGYGNFFETVCTLDNIYKLTYAHCLSIEDFNIKNEGETMAISDNTGNSTGSHLHLTVKKIKIEGGQHIVQNYNNGYFGAINPQLFFDELRAYKTSNKVPTVPDNLTVTVDEATFEHLVKGATVRKELAIWLGFDTPDEAPLDKFKSHISGLKSHVTSLENTLKSKDIDLAEKETEIQNQKDKLANITEQCQRDKDLLSAQIDKLNKDLKNSTIVLDQLQGTVSVLEGKLREAQKTIGLKDIEIAKLQAGENTDSKLVEAIADFIKKLLGKINS